MLGHKVATAGREIWAYARQAALLPLDLGRPPLPELGEDDDLVVGLHGLFATGGVMRPLRARLERRGVATAAMSYAAGRGIASLAERLGEWLGDVPARVHLVGHSLGGIVARYYAVHAGDRRVVQTISLASPFAGVKRLPGVGIPLLRDLDEASLLLRQLRLARGVPHLSLVAADDHIVASPLAHALPSGEVLVVDRCGHNGMLFDERVADHVARRILQRLGRTP